LTAYQARRVIYIGDGRGGATGDDRMHRILETQWAEVASRQPVQWWGQHDRMMVYERGA
jgi:hypothetical protein